MGCFEGAKLQNISWRSRLLLYSSTFLLIKKVPKEQAVRRSVVMAATSCCRASWRDATAIKTNRDDAHIVSIGRGESEIKVVHRTHIVQPFVFI